MSIHHDSDECDIRGHCDLCEDCVCRECFFPNVELDGSVLYGEHVSRFGIVSVTKQPYSGDYAIECSDTEINEKWECSTFESASEIVRFLRDCADRIESHD